MATLRKDFNLNREYSVDVSNCSEEEKKKVQQAFFDAGFTWEIWGNEYKNLDAIQYTNTSGSGVFSKHLMYGRTAEKCNMSPDIFFSYVYEPEQVGHIHAVLMAQYAEDAKTHIEPWKLWQIKDHSGVWVGCDYHPSWQTDLEYRRKPKTRIIHGIEITDFEFKPKVGEAFYAANVGLPEFFEHAQRASEHCTFTQRMIERGLIYPRTEEGRQAAILHAKAMLGIAQ